MYKNSRWLLWGGSMVIMLGIALIALFNVLSSREPVGAQTTTPNRGISSDTQAEIANYDGWGYSYSAQALAAAGVHLGQPLHFKGYTFTWLYPSDLVDNDVAAGQTHRVISSSKATRLAFLGSATNGATSGQVKLTYTDGSSQLVTLGFSDWTLGSGKASIAYHNQVVVQMPYRNDRNGSAGKDTVTTYLFEADVALLPGKTLQSITLPASTDAGNIHVFAFGTNADTPLKLNDK